MHTLSDTEANWDRRKERANIRKHGVDFSDAAVALEDVHALCVAFYENDEHRYKTLAASPVSGVLFIIHTEYDGETVRIISARRADRTQRIRYRKGLTIDD